MKTRSTYLQGNTYQQGAQLDSGDLIHVRWGDGQPEGTANCSGKPGWAMLANSGATEYTVVGSGNATITFEIVTVSVTANFASTVSEGGNTTATVTRTGSTSYALTVSFYGLTGAPYATFSPTQDYDISVNGTYVGSSSGFVIPSGSSSANLILWALLDGVFESGPETAGIDLTTPSGNNYLVGTGNHSYASINAN
jgi:hypothetical protein